MKEYLPIGTIVKVKSIEKKVMIAGISQVKDSEKIERWDYVSVLYPTGIYAEDSFYYFNSDDIIEVVFRGYDDEERQEFLKIVNEAELIINEAEKEAEKIRMENAHNAFE